MWYLALDSLPTAISYFNTAIQHSQQQGNKVTTTKALLGLSTVQDKQEQLQPALATALQALQLAQAMGQTQLLRDASERVSTAYECLGAMAMHWRISGNTKPTLTASAASKASGRRLPTKRITNWRKRTGISTERIAAAMAARIHLRGG